jgi:hypothetical protein
MDNFSDKVNAAKSSFTLNRDDINTIAGGSVSNVTKIGAKAIFSSRIGKSIGSYAKGIGKKGIDAGKSIFNSTSKKYDAAKTAINKTSDGIKGSFTNKYNAAKEAITSQKVKGVAIGAGVAAGGIGVENAVESMFSGGENNPPNSHENINSYYASRMNPNTNSSSPLNSDALDSSEDSSTNDASNIRPHVLEGEYIPHNNTIGAGLNTINSDSNNDIEEILEKIYSSINETKMVQSNILLGVQSLVKFNTDTRIKSTLKNAEKEAISGEYLPNQQMTAIPNQELQQPIDSETNSASKFKLDKDSLTKLGSLGIMGAAVTAKAMNPNVSSGNEWDNKSPIEDSMSPQSSNLGAVSKNYESGSLGVGAISSGLNDKGGASYGEYQLASAGGKSSTLSKYLNQSGYGDEFRGMTPGTPEFNSKWKDLADNNTEFGKSQHDFIKKTHYDPAQKYANKIGIDTSDAGMQQAIWSASVQHGGVNKILDAARHSEGWDAKSQEDKIRQLYESRSEYTDSLKDVPYSAGRGRFKNEVESAVQFSKLNTNKNSGKLTSDLLDSIPDQIPRQSDKMDVVSSGLQVASLLSAISQKQAQLQPQPVLPQIPPQQKSPNGTPIPNVRNDEPVLLQMQFNNVHMV